MKIFLNYLKLSLEIDIEGLKIPRQSNPATFLNVKNLILIKIREMVPIFNLKNEDLKRVILDLSVKITSGYQYIHI